MNPFPINVERNVSDVGFLVLFAFLWLVVGMIAGAGVCGMFKNIYGYGTPEEIQSIKDDVYNKYEITMPNYTDSLDAWFFSNCVNKQVLRDPPPTTIEEIEQTCQDEVRELKDMGDSMKSGMDQVIKRFDNLPKEHDYEMDDD